MDLNHIFATNLRIYRTKAGLTQKQLAELTGLNQIYVCRLESMKDNIKISTIEKIAKALGVAPYLLFCPPRDFATIKSLSQETQEQKPEEDSTPFEDNTYV